ncbi:GspMb/PilO family protein [Piscinibacter gummiphilus]|uniref:Uncharacterized protein n=1 Tax=Piscinibacter gummiphilus TaxID=946333 RepID=A0A1W6LGJ2_9BURK|nr:GspMb/PilO family protein [Piscinibacter gummiphilus]ARN23333.1 hypothetical protein A4W93_27415 [Piscinibacter gummiphilus]GLS97332.1 hypothetical protein GCM10007918_46240 [Piscinibacter gummiphilus]
MSAWRVRLGIARHRQGPGAVAAAVLLALGLAAWTWLLPRHLAARQAPGLDTVAPAVVREADDPQARLRAVLVEPAQVQAVLARLVEAAQVDGLASGRVGYHRDEAAATRVRLELPVRGGYPALKRFLGAALASHPGVSVDQVDVRRDTGGTGLEGTVWLSVWSTAVLDGEDPP